MTDMKMLEGYCNLLKVRFGVIRNFESLDHVRFFFSPKISQPHSPNSTSPTAGVLTSLFLVGDSSISLLNHLFNHLIIQPWLGANLAELESTGALSYIQLGEVPFGPGTRDNQKGEQHGLGVVGSWMDDEC